MGRVSLLFLLLLSLPLSQGREQLEVGIIGAGIGGSATAFYLKEFFPEAKATVFEKRDYIGGRLNDVVVGGKMVEVGGTIWSKENLYVVEATKILNIPLVTSSDPGNGEVGFWTGLEWAPWEDILDQNPLSLARIIREISTFGTALGENYAQREQSPPFETVGEFLSYAALDTYAQETSQDFLDEVGISLEFTDTLIVPVMRQIYNQGLTMNAFSCLVSLVSADSETYRSDGGNKQIPMRMLEHANASVFLSSQVTKVKKGSERRFSVEVTSEKGGKEVHEFDFVVLAAPFEHLEISFEGLSLPEIPERGFVTWVVTHVVAERINPAYFGNFFDPVPDFVYTTEAADKTTPFVSIGYVTKSVDGFPIYKIFSRQDLQAYLPDIFVNVKEVHVHVWPYTFPLLDPPASGSGYQPVILAPGMYYLNTIESVASAMEGSTLAARNVAQHILSSLLP